MIQPSAFGIQARRRWPVIGLALVSFGWLAAAAVGVAIHWPIQTTPAGLIPFAADLLPPLVVLLLALSLLPEAGARPDLEVVETRVSRASEATGDLERHLGAIELKLTALATRSEQLASAAYDETTGLATAAATLAAKAAEVAKSGGEANRAVAALGEALVPVGTQADTIATSLARVAGQVPEQVRAVDVLLSQVRARSMQAAVEADQSIAAMTTLIAKIDEASTRTTAAIAKRAYALDAAVDGVLERTTALLDQVREGVGGSARALQESVETAQQQLDLFGGTGTRIVGQRLDLLMAAANQLRQQFAEHETSSERMKVTVEGHLVELGSRFDEAGRAGETMLGGMSARIGAVGHGLSDLREPLSASLAAVTGLDAHVGTLRQSADELGASLEAKLGAAESGVASLRTNAGALLEGIDRLRAAMTEGAAAMDQSSGAFANERAQLLGLSDEIGRHFDSARGALAEIGSTTGATTAETTAALADVVARVRDMAETTAATLRHVLGEIVDETAAALAHAGSDVTERAFGEPVRAGIAAVEGASTRAAEIAGRATERVRDELARLEQTIAASEKRIDQADTHFEVRARDTLAARSVRLIDMLNESSVDVAKLLAIPVSDTAWAHYLRGDRGVFTRTTVRLLDRESTRRIARHYDHDAPFREEASRYLDLFETLIDRVRDDPDGEAFATTMLSSDIGKLYAAIAQAVGRTPTGTA